MDRWLGDGGMAIIAAIGGSFDAYGVDGEDLGWVTGTFTPLELACNPHGSVQAGVHAVILDAAMNFAINAALRGKDRTNATIEMTTELMRPATRGERYVVRGDVVRLTRQIAYAEATVSNPDGKLVSRATGTFLVHRDAT
ncbi:MAG: PaaI family thioesterase [Acidimicrobiales bacterium]